MHPRQRWLALTVGILAAVIALVVLTALLTAAGTSASANDKLNKVTARLEVVTAQQQESAAQQAATAAQLTELKREATRRQRQTVAARTVLIDQNRANREAIAALTAFLRAHGLAVPRVVVRVQQATTPPAATTPSPTPVPLPVCPGKSGKHGKKKGCR